MAAGMPASRALPGWRSPIKSTLPSPGPTVHSRSARAPSDPSSRACQPAIAQSARSGATSIAGPPHRLSFRSPRSRCPRSSSSSTPPTPTSAPPARLEPSGSAPWSIRSSRPSPSSPAIWCATPSGSPRPRRRATTICSRRRPGSSRGRSTPCPAITRTSESSGTNPKSAPTIPSTPGRCTGTTGDPTTTRTTTAGSISSASTASTSTISPTTAMSTACRRRGWSRIWPPCPPRRR